MKHKVPCLELAVYFRVSMRKRVQIQNVDMTWHSLFDQNPKNHGANLSSDWPKYEGPITLCSQKHEEDQLQLQC